MPMLDAADVADLTDVYVTAQTPFALVLKRYNDNAGQPEALPSQDVQAVYQARLQASSPNEPGTAILNSPLTFSRKAPFDVAGGDTFVYDGKRGKITRVFTEPVLGIISAESNLDGGR